MSNLEMPKYTWTVEAEEGFSNLLCLRAVKKRQEIIQQNSFSLLVTQFMILLKTQSNRQICNTNI